MSTTTTDPIADMLTRIRNAILVRKNNVSLPHSKSKEAIAQLLVDNKFIDQMEVEDVGIGKMIHIVINDIHTNARITEISRVSKPGRRQYVRAGNIPTVKQGRGVVLISTSKGLMTGSEARKIGVGGELICKVY